MVHDIDALRRSEVYKSHFPNYLRDTSHVAKDLLALRMASPLCSYHDLYEKFQQRSDKENKPQSVLSTYSPPEVEVVDQSTMTQKELIETLVKRTFNINGQLSQQLNGEIENLKRKKEERRGKGEEVSANVTNDEVLALYSGIKFPAFKKVFSGGYISTKLNPIASYGQEVLLEINKDILSGQGSHTVSIEGRDYMFSKYGVRTQGARLDIHHNGAGVLVKE